MEISETSMQRTRPVHRSDVTLPRYAVELAVVGLAYFVGAKAGLHLALVDRQVTPLWPPTGIALAALLVLGPRMWPAIAVGAFLVNLPLGPSPLGAAGIAVGNTLAPLTAYGLLRAVGFRTTLDRLRDAAALVFLGGCGMLVSATLGSLVLLASHAIAARDYPTTWWVWWTGDALGVFVFAPFVLSLLHAPARALLRPTRIAEAVVLLTGSAIVIHAALQASFHPLYLVFPFVIWAAYRFRQVGAASVVLIATVSATLAVAHRWGPFQGETLLRRMAALHTFNATAALTAFFLAAITAERVNAILALRRAGSELEQRVTERTSELSSTNERLEREVAERTRVESALHESRAILEEAQRLAHVGSWSWDMLGGVVQWSDEMYRIYGYEPRSFGVTFERAMERVHPDDRGRIMDNLQSRVGGGLEDDVDPIEYRIILADGRVRTLQGHGRITFRDGVATHMVGTVQDVTAVKRAEDAMRNAYEREREAAEQLRAADELKTEFLSIASHELRTPLTPVLGFADLLLTDEGLDEDTRRDMITRIHTNAASMQDLIGRLLDDSRLQAGHVDLHVRPLVVRDEIRRCVDDLGPLVGRHSVAIDVTDGLTVMADPHAFDRILANLVNNALKFSPPGGTVTITSRANGVEASISVQDEGPGIGVGDEQRVFERFYQATRTRRGTGIGLSIAHRYVDLLNGRIWVENRPGGGATFTFTLPLHRET